MTDVQYKLAQHDVLLANIVKKLENIETKLADSNGHSGTGQGQGRIHNGKYFL